MIDLEIVASICSDGDVTLNVYGVSCYSEFLGRFGKVREIEGLGRWYIRLTDGYSIWADKIQKGD